MSTFLIAEIACCHDNAWWKVEALVAECARAGFDACKLQYWSSADRLADRRRATPEYRAIYHKYAIPPGWLLAFQQLCHRHHLEAVCTVYLPEDVELVAKYSDRLKIASFENEDDELIALAMQTGNPVIMSCGLGGPKNDRHHGPGCDYLACVSAYPAPIDGALAVFVGETDRYFEGYSDHTKNTLTGAVAVACGASIIEVHVRLHEVAPDNPDLAFALAPDEFHEYVRNVRLAERMIAPVPVDESAMLTFKVRP